MKNRSRTARVALAAVAWACAGSAMLHAQDKKRIAVLDFDYQTVHSSVYELFGGDVDIGQGIATMLVTQLVKNGTYSIIERQALDKILKEQNFQASGRADPSSAAQLGKLLGVDAVVTGAITQFGRDDKKVGIGGAGIGPVKIGGLGKSSAKATVAVDARLIDVTTAEILAVAEGKGESGRSGALIGGKVGGVGGAVDMQSSNFGGTIIGEATRKAVDDLTKAVVDAAPKIVARKVEISALVADVTGAEATISVGASAGVKKGASYDVIRPGREIKDPATGRVIRRVTTPVGTLTITEVGPDYAVGQVSGGPAKAGDCVGTCPSAPATPTAAPEQAAAPAPAAAPVVAAVGAIAALPSGSWAWSPYQFKGTEHFRYDVRKVDGKDVETGFYTLDIQPASGGSYKMRVDGKLGDDAYSSTVTAPSANGGGMGGMMGMGQLMALGPIGLTLFNPMWGMMFMGHELTLGDGWAQSSGGHSTSVKVESKCQYAGVNGLLTVMRENQEVKSESCLSPNVPLPLGVTLHDGKSDVTEMKLVEFRP